MRRGEESKCLLGQECDEYGEPVAKLVDFGSGVKDVGR